MVVFVATGRAASEAATTYRAVMVSEGGLAWRAIQSIDRALTLVGQHSVREQLVQLRSDIATGAAWPSAAFQALDNLGIR